MDVVLWWHLHQPDYREPTGDTAGLPWVRMHALRAYTDLPAFLLDEGLTGMTLNIVPSLADQLDDLASGRVLDRHYRVAHALAEGHEEAVRDAFMLHAAPAPRPMLPLPRLDELRQKAAAHAQASSQEALDACVLFHLSWLGFTAFQDPIVRELFSKGRDFGSDDLHYLLALSRRMASDVLPRLRQARESGACHVTATPYYHPILPLLIDTRSAHEATRDGGAPIPFGCPPDALHQVQKAASRHRELFSEELTAMWPAEGSLSEKALHVFAEAGIEVVASDEALLRKSLGELGGGGRWCTDVPAKDAHLHPWKHQESGVNLLFRDRRLSDDWGFVYRELTPDDAGQAFLAGVRDRYARGASVSAVILDGENPFEHYPNAGLEHLKGFARASRGNVNFVSPQEAVQKNPKSLPRIATGSWIDASFDIWAGDEEDRRAWALLAEVHALVEDATLDDNTREKAREHLLAAEGSDWFWWYGPEFPISDRPRFDHLFRQHLTAALDVAGISRDTVPALRVPVLRTKRHASGRQALPLGEIARDGSQESSWPWLNAMRVRSDGSQGSMHRGAPVLEEVAALCSHENLNLRVRTRDDVTEAELHIRWRHLHQILSVPLAAPDAGIRTGRLTMAWDDLPALPGDSVEIFVEAQLGGSSGSRLPAEEGERFLVPRPGPWSIEA